jgi:esterase/lipase superfamily enzyme
LWKLQFREDPEKHVTIVTSEEKDLSAWKAIAAERLRDAGTHAALVFVHGFNVSFDDAIRRSGQIGWDLQFHGLIAAFSWCSQGEVLSYFTDESNARLAVPRFVEFLRVLRDEVGISTIHVIAHSMGNLVLVEALRKMSSLGDQQLLLEEVVLAAPDLDADEFKAAVQEIAGKAKRYTLYGSEDDKALAASKKLRSNYPRAGDGGEHLLVVEGVESIDATSVGEDLFGLGHSYFASKRTVLSDLYYVIKESLPPWRRDGLDEAHVGSLRYWVFVP